MGVPSFYRWLSTKWPKVVVDVMEAPEGEEDSDNSRPNPNGQEFDYLYLDMNGIIHPCSHPEDKDAPPTEDDIMVEIMKYIDRLFNIVRPRKMLFMAIDGVAPRAKMNQQRSRRFRAAQEAAEKAAMEAKLAEENPNVAPLKPKEKFDSNCITPGTLFMKKVSDSLAYYVADRQSKDKAWANIKVVLSDANVPGEGEHKIMEFIRSQRLQDGYDPNLRHCIYGLDADLIMLTLATHEPHFTILREVVFFGNNNTCHTCGQPGHIASECRGRAAVESKEPAKKKPYQFLYVSVLREYLVQEMHPANLTFEFSGERVIDDFVFLCFFVGNDFLPHLPTLEIREGAIELLMSIYNRVLPKLDGYVTNSGELNLERAEAIVKEIGALEDQILLKRREDEARQKERRQRQRGQQNQREQQREHARRSVESLMMPRLNNHSVADSYRAALVTGTIPEFPELPPAVPQPLTRSSTGGADEEDDPPDELRMGEEGWRARYYKQKFDIAIEDETARATHTHHMAQSYVEGLCWVLKYYYQGCCSWRWFYPFHYAPFSGDMTSIKDLGIKFEKGTPFHPFEQLMCVLPLASKQCLPEVCQKLMESPDSPLYKYYPLEFKIDRNGKKAAWMGVALLPFIDEKEFLPAVKAIDNEFSHEEKQRNRWGHDIICAGGSSPFGEAVRSVYSHGTHGKQSVDPAHSQGMFGEIFALPHADKHFDKAYPSPLGNCPPVVPNKSVCCYYEMPQVPADHIFVAGLLPGAQPPPPALSADEGLRRRPNADRDAVSRLINRGLTTQGARFHPTAGRMESDRNRAYDEGPRHQPMQPPGPSYHGGGGYGGGRGGQSGHKRSHSDDDFSRRGAPRYDGPPHQQQHHGGPGGFGAPGQQQHQQQFARGSAPPFQFAPNPQFPQQGGAPGGFPGGPGHFPQQPAHPHSGPPHPGQQQHQQPYQPPQQPYQQQRHQYPNNSDPRFRR